MLTRFVILSSLALLAPRARAADADVVIYGGTSAGVTAAIQTALMGKTAVLIEPGQHLGGLTSSGLGKTDSGNKAVIGGLSRRFYQRVKKHYENPEAWTYGSAATDKTFRKGDDAMWVFEPKVAEKILRDMLAEHKNKITLVMGERLDRTPGKGVKTDGKRITAIVMESGKTFQGAMFIDATYEGDLMAAAGVSYTVGREPNAKYGETLNGVEAAKNISTHRFLKNVDPYVKPGDKSSGLLFGIETDPLPPDGEGDQRVQAYCYRMCMTLDPKNQLPFAKPEGYDESKYELLFRNFEAGDMRLPLSPGMLPNGKTDTNNNFAVSTDFIGQSYKYPEAGYAERDAILKEHEVYQKGLMWCLAHHPRVPEAIRNQMKKWGLAKDEFTDNGGWPHQIYVREARRMVSDYVVTENDCRRVRQTPVSVGMGSYNMDSHNCARYVTPAGFVQNEGDIQVSPGGPYRISYYSIVPKKGECANLLVPVCLSCSHIAYGSIRMEPVFMILGQSAATAAVLSINAKCDVQSLDMPTLRERLLADKQVLEYDAPPKPGAIDPKKLPGVVVDDADAKREGFDLVSTSVGPFVGSGYRHDGALGDGKQSIRFTPDLPTTGMYEVRLSYTVNPNRAANVPVVISSAEGEKTVVVNQKKAPPIDKTWISLGQFRFEKGKSGSVEIRNAGVNGHVIADAVQWLPVK